MKKIVINLVNLFIGLAPITMTLGGIALFNQICEIIGLVD